MSGAGSRGIEAQVRCICGSPELLGSLLSAYLGRERAFCSAGCKREFDQHPWVYTFYVASRREVCATPMLPGGLR